jgi:glycosyltransferase involved in cell wall biosynthesis
MTRRPRVVLIAASLPTDLTGGMQVQAETAARELSRVFDVLVLARAIRRPPGVDRTHAYTVVRKRVVRVPGLRLLVDAVQSLWILHRVGRAADALLCYQTLSSGLIGVLAGRLLRIPTIVSIRGEEEYRLARAPWPTRQLSRLTWAMTDRILLQSAQLRADFLVAAQGEGFPRAALEARTGVVPNGVQGCPSEVAVDRPDRLITVARLHPHKGVSVLLDALREIPEGERPHVLLIGDGPLAGTLRTAAHGLPVTFAGDLAYADVQAQLAEGGIFVLPSIEEGSPNVLLEALAHGLPVLATAVGGVPDLIQDGANGLLVAAGDAEALGRGIQRLRDDAELRARLREAGPVTAARFSGEALGRRLEAEIRQVSARARSS